MNNTDMLEKYDNETEQNVTESNKKSKFTDWEKNDTKAIELEMWKYSSLLVIQFNVLDSFSWFHMHDSNKLWPLQKKRH